VHNVIVCTLCSCYPRALLGRPPDWYKSLNYRSRVVVDPRQVLTEFGLALEPGVEVRVYDSTADMRYLVIPQRPAGTDHMSEEELAQLVTRDSMIGVTRARQPGVTTSAPA
jgi:nitrile hydratase